MRKSFDSLSVLVTQVIRQDPLSGHLFVFRSRLGDRLKILYWDRDGYCLWYKRLEEGTFHLPESKQEQIEMSAAELSMLIEGIDLTHAKRHKRFSLDHPKPIAP
jgi:transposase